MKIRIILVSAVVAEVVKNACSALVSVSNCRNSLFPYHSAPQREDTTPPRPEGGPSTAKGAPPMPELIMPLLRGCATCWEELLLQVLTPSPMSQRRSARISVRALPSAARFI